MKDAMGKLSRILVVSQMTRNCREAFRMGVSLARQNNAELYLVHVVHNPFGIEGWNLPLPSLEKDFQKLLRESREDMEKLVAAEKSEGLKLVELIREGDPVDEVVKAVEEYEIDLLVMLAHEEGKLEHFSFWPQQQ